MGTQMAKLLEAAGQAAPWGESTSLRLTLSMRSLSKWLDEADEQAFGRWVEVLLGQAMLAEKGSMEDPSATLRCNQRATDKTLVFRLWAKPIIMNKKLANAGFFYVNVANFIEMSLKLRTRRTQTLSIHSLVLISAKLNINVIECRT